MFLLAGQRVCRRAKFGHVQVLDAQELLGKLEGELQQQSVRSTLWITEQRNLDVSVAQTEDG